ncbi:MAG: hypothetical protein AAFY42_04620 [Pseudomonadota bacterium]
MFAKQEDILLLDERRSKSGGAVDHVAAASAVLVAGLGLAQLFMPLMAAPLTGIEGSTGAQIVGLQWALLGGLLAFGGLFRMRVVTIFAAEFLFLTGVAAAIVSAINHPDMMPLLVNGAVALVGLINSGLARLVDKADMKRELRIARETAKLASAPVVNDTDAKEL